MQTGGGNKYQQDSSGMYQPSGNKYSNYPNFFGSQNQSQYGMFKKDNLQMGTSRMDPIEGNALNEGFNPNKTSGI